VQTQVLDIDASGGTSEQCGLAIQASMNKLKANDGDHTHLLNGQCTDNGGGGVLEGLHTAMDTLGLCAASNYLIANCCIHSIQIQLGNAIKTTFGEGAIDKINATQMLHSMYRLQESIDLDEWRHILFTSSQFVAEYDPTNATVGASKNKQAFLESFKLVYGFHSKFHKTSESDPTTLVKYEETIYGKMTAPILTRWWTFGKASSYMFKYYLMLYHACQVIINMYKSSSTPNIIASVLFSLMSDQENFLDLTLIRSFHKRYLNGHVDWFQDCNDLVTSRGFQAHHIAIRYHLMDQDVKTFMWGRSMPDYDEAVALYTKSDHRDKLDVFMRAVNESLHKHFKRWLLPSLLPAALLSEAPTAKVVSAIILQEAMPSIPEHYDQRGKEHYFHSDVHKVRINLNLMYKFFRDSLQDEVGNDEYVQLAKHAARLVFAQDIDIRSPDYHSEHGPTRWQMHSTYLPLPSHTEFVESVVKDAKEVSSTDRSEEHRTWMAITRSATPLGKSKSTDEDLSFNANKILAILKSSVDRATPHEHWGKHQVDNAYDARLAQIQYSLQRGHFKNDRIEAKRNNVDELAPKYKRPNVAQQQKAQQLTPAVTGLIPYGKLVKKRNMEDLQDELLHRGVEPEDVPKSITDRKKMLQDLEMQRLLEAGMEQQAATEQSKKHFLKQSDAPFKLDD